MASPVPTPVAAALGLVPTLVGGALRLPGRAVHSAIQLPVFAVSSALAGLDLARREYDDLAGRGERLLGRLRGQSFDELEDVVEQSLKGTPLARPYDAVEDALEDALDTVNRAVTGARTAAGKAVTTSAQTAARTADRAADQAETAARKAAGTTEQTGHQPGGQAAEAVGKVGDVANKAARKAEGIAEKAAGGKVAGVADKTADVAGKAAGGVASKPADLAKKAAGAVQEPLPEAERPKGTPTPAARQPDATRPDTAASADVLAKVEQVAGGPSSPPAHDELPLPDYDHMTLGSLRGRLRSLTLEQLRQVRAYEKAHADRLPVVTMLDNRIAKLASDAGPGPDGVAPDRPAAGQSATKGGSKVSPATQAPAPDTAPHGGLGNSPTAR